jgi:hypothetical protein
MRKIIPILLCGVALASLPFSGAGASTFQIVNGNGNALQLNANFNPTGWTNPSGIGVGTTIETFNAANASSGGLEINPSISGPAAVTLVFTYMGFEAAYTNVAEASFSYNSATPMFINQSTSVGASSGPVTVNLTNPGYIPFLFASQAYTPNAVATNNGTIDLNVELGFVIDPNNSSIAYAFFEDIAANCPGRSCTGDQDFDDMVVKIQIISSNELTAPLPAALPLFASGLAGFGLLGWRRKQKKDAAAA